MRQDNKREHYAKWYSAFKQNRLWQDEAPIRANVTFRFENETEKVSYSNWKAEGVSSKDYNDKFSYDYLESKNRLEDKEEEEFI